MTKTSKISFKSVKGAQFEAIIEFTREVQDNINYADGWNVNLGKELYENVEIKIYTGDKYVTSNSEHISNLDNMLSGDRYIKALKCIGAYAMLGSGNKLIAISKDVYNQIISTIAELKSEAAVVEIAEHVANKTVETKSTVKIPQEAIEAYNEYKGDANKAWEAEDEKAWALINKLAPYIEAQHGVNPEKFFNALTESVREADYGIND